MSMKGVPAVDTDIASENNLRINDIVVLWQPNASERKDDKDDKDEARKSKLLFDVNNHRHVPEPQTRNFLVSYTKLSAKPTGILVDPATASADVVKDRHGRRFSA